MSRPKVFDAIIGELLDGRSLHQCLADRRMSGNSFHAILLRDPKLARGYMLAKEIQSDEIDAKPNLAPRKDWVAEAEAATCARWVRQERKDIQFLERIEVKIEARRLKEMNWRPAPPRLPTIDDLQKTGDVISIYDLRRRNVLQPDGTVIGKPARLPAVEKLVAVRYRLQIHFKGRDVPQSVAIEWIPTAVYARPLFRCGCGRRALMLYPTAKAYVCRYCVLRGLPRYRASSKYRSPNRFRVRAPIARGRHGPIKRDAATGRFLPSSR